MWCENRPTRGLTPPSNNERKPLVHPKIFNVNILFLVQGTLRDQKIPIALRGGGGAWWVPVAHGLNYHQLYGSVILWNCIFS